METNIKVQHETIVKGEKSEEFNLINYGSNLNKQLNYIQSKIDGAEKKITALRTKEKIIDDMIHRTNDLVERYNEEKNYKLAGVNQKAILTQFETLAQVQEMLIKYEDMIQKYIKMSVDIENHKINAYVKLNSSKKEEEKTEQGYEKLMGAMHQLISSQTQDPEQGPGGPTNPAMLEAVKKQLNLEGY